MKKVNMRFVKEFLLYLLGAFGCIISGMWVSTQQIAKMLNYPIEFGEPYFLFGKILYLPQFMYWWFKYGDYAPDQFEDASVASVVGALAGTIFILVFAFLRVSVKPKPTSQGTARWATKEEVENSELVTGKGVVLGMTQDKKHYLCHDGPEHVLLVAPTGSGKGISTVLTTLFSWPESMVVLDIKRENWEKTSSFRKKHLNNIVIKFEPANGDGSSARFNPLDEIRIRTPYEASDVQNIVHMMVFTTEEGSKGDPHWNINAADFLFGVVMHLKYTQEKASLPSVASFLRQNDIEDILIEMMSTEHVEDETFFSSIYDSNIIADLPKTHPEVYKAAKKMENTPEKERGSIYSSTVSKFDLYKDPIISRNVSESNFCIEDLMDYEKPVSLYLVTPQGELPRLKKLFRIIVDLIFHKLTGPMSASKEEVHKYRLLMLLDEFPALERMDKIQSALAWARGYKIKIVLVVQEINQIYQHYTKENSIFGNTKVKVFHTPDDLETPKYISEALGKWTEIVENKSYQRAFFGHLLKSVTVSTQETARPLLTPDEVGQLTNEDEIIFMSGKRPILARKIKYFEDEIFSKRELKPPVATSDLIHIPPKSTTITLAKRIAKLIPEPAPEEIIDLDDKIFGASDDDFDYEE